MSYTNTINTTRTPPHHIAGNVKATNSQGTITEQTLKKVANFIGMDDGHHEVQPTAIGYLSTDLELELAARRSAFKETATLEATELQRRLDSDTSAVGKAGALKTAEEIEAWFNNGFALRQSRDLIETRAFFKHMHEETNEIQRAERDNRLADDIGETFRKSLAEEQIALIKTGIASPHLNHFSVSKLEPIKQTLSRATEIASGAAGSVWGSMFQIGQFAARAAHFLGGKAAAKAEVIEREVPEVLGEVGQAISQLGKPASKLVQDTQEAFDELLAPSTLSWAQLDTMESEERAFRTGELNGDEVGQLHRFMLASATSSLIRARNENRTLVSKFYVTELLEEMERERRIAQNKTNPTARLNAKRAAGIIMSHRRRVLCKQSAQAKAQEVRAASPQPTRHIQFALPTSAPHPKRAVPQLASKRYNHARESSSENLLAAPKAAM